MNNKFNLLSVGSDAKTVKGQKYGYLTGILYLAPANISGFEVCSHRSPNCTTACLFTSGRGAMTRVQNARISKTQLLFNNRTGFLDKLQNDIELLISKATKNNLIPCIRLNGTSDLGWEGIAKNILNKYPHVQFYDYTKNINRMKIYLKGKMPKNYHLTFSRSENNWHDCLEVLRLGGNVAIVFGKYIPIVWEGYKVVPGDDSDLRFLDDKGVIVGLKAKGKARYDTSGFVVAYA